MERTPRGWDLQDGKQSLAVSSLHTAYKAPKTPTEESTFHNKLKVKLSAKVIALINGNKCIGMKVQYLNLKMSIEKHFKNLDSSQYISFTRNLVL